MSNDLESLLAEGVITEVVARLKSGKEADVFVVRYQGRDVAAKVYKDRSTRSFKNNAAYKEGRSVRSSRSQRAIDKGTKFGREAEEDAWKSAEVDAIYRLHAAGVRVPAPVLYFDGVLLMELVLDAEGAAARRVIDVPLTEEDARAAYEDVLRQLVRILSCDLIHGDLSPYNVLWAATGPTIIDFPQVISASHNSASEQFFLRDARNILGYFATIDRSLNVRSGDPFEIWRAYRRRELTPDFVPRSRPGPLGQRPIPIARTGQAPHDDRRGPPRRDRGPDLRAPDARGADRSRGRGPDTRPQGAPTQQGRPDLGARGRGGPQDRGASHQGRGPGQGPREGHAQGRHAQGGQAQGGQAQGGQAHGGQAHGGRGNGQGRPQHGQGRGSGQGRGDPRAFGAKRAALVPEVIVRRSPGAVAREESAPQAPVEKPIEAEIAPTQPVPRRRRVPG